MIREFKKNDLPECLEIVDAVWKFKEVFTPPDLGNYFLRVYTEGSLLESNYSVIIEEDNRPIGFLFGKIRKTSRLKRSTFRLFGLRLKIKIRLFWGFILLKEVSLNEKKKLIKAVREEEINKRKAGGSGGNEIILFAVSPLFQKKGLGRKLIERYIADCQTNSQKNCRKKCRKKCRKDKSIRIVLNTDEFCNFDFYYHMGFTKTGQYDSPLIGLYSKKPGISYIFELKIPGVENIETNPVE